MDAARPLRDVFAALAQDEDPHSAHDVLRASGHTDLPDGLVAEAVGTYADTAPIEVAEHLSPYVMAHSSVPLPDVADVDPSGWLNAVVTAPVVDRDLPSDPADDLDGGTDLDAYQADATVDGSSDDSADDGFDDNADHTAASHDIGMDFGHGTDTSVADGTDVDHTAIADPGHADGQPADLGYDPSGFDSLDDLDDLEGLDDLDDTDSTTGRHNDSAVSPDDDGTDGDLPDHHAF